MKSTVSNLTSKILWIAALVLVAKGTSGCLQPSTNPQSLANSIGVSSATPAGPKAAQVIFTDSGSGSFSAPSVNGTSTGAGNGLQAKELFNADGSALTTTGGTGDPNWPAWLNYVEIGISGTNNAAANNANCATFDTSAEASAATCNFPSGAATCDVANTFRVSEYDCVSGAASVGNGTSSDGIYIRANFNRANLGSSENIMVVVNYAASSFDQASSNPSNCFTGGIFTPESCSDFAWRVYMHHGATEGYVQPFLMLVPPMFSYVNGNTTAAGTQIQTSQFIIPFAGDANLDTIQFSRTGSTLTTGTTNFKTDCNGSAAAADSPLCAGIVFYSMTFFRI